MQRLRAMSVALVASLPLAAARAGDSAPPAPLKCTSADPMKCEVCRPAYDKAMAYVRSELRKSTFAVKMVAGWLFLADGRFGQELDHCVDKAVGWRKERRWRERSHSGNWYPALAGVFLAECYKHRREKRVLDAMRETVGWFVSSQEPRNKGWWKWQEGAYKERLDYSVVNHGYVMSLVMTFFYGARVHGVEIPEETFTSGDEALLHITTGRGIGYGLPRKGGHGWGDKTGARGAWVIQALAYSGNLEHKVWTVYEKLLTKRIPQMDQGHHVGAFHALALTLGCHVQGPQAYKQLTDHWLARLMAKQGAEGNLYIGDDGAAGGEPGLLRGDVGSTAAFALMILLQDHARLIPESRARARDGSLTFRVDLAKKRERERKAREAKARAEASRQAAEDARKARLAADRAIAQEAAKVWDAKLLARVREAVAAKTKFTFRSSMIRGRAKVRGVDDRGRLLVSDRAGQLTMPVEVGRLPMGDRRGIAVALVRPGNPGDHCLAAFYCLAAGDADRGEALLKKGGSGAAAVRAFFKRHGI
ncbi:MAG: DUF6288 domain-containing protein [Planctomycetota bacterium]